MKIGDYVKHKIYGYEGIINRVFENWDDLKNKSSFITIAPNIDEYDSIELLINDPRDNWLKAQEIPHNEEELE